MKPDIIGRIPEQLATFDDLGNQLTETTFIKGFHVNFTKDVPDLSDYKMNPQPDTPYRIYAGGIMPVCYKFENKAEWERVNPFRAEGESRHYGA